MFAVEVRDHIMIAHSFPSPVFGPAQKLHGATFVVDATFFCEQLDDHGLVVDIGLATTALASVLEPLRYQNLDEQPGFKGKFTTTEFLAHHIWQGLRRSIEEDALKCDGRVVRMRVTLGESHVARGWYEGEI